MFSGCNSLRGAATNVGKSFDVSMANPGRGYFTRKVLSQEVEAYVHLSEDQTTLTFYYDTLRADRDGTTWRIRDTKKGFFETIPAWTSDWNSPNITVHTTVFDASFRDFRPNNTARWFNCLNSLKSVEGLEHLNTSQVMDMRFMFYGCSSLTTLDLSSFDTSQVMDMRFMFKGCSSLTTLDLSSFDTSQVTDMRVMFKDCFSLTSLDLSRFDTSQVTDMNRMFAGCRGLRSLDLSSFATSKVTNMFGMFSGCSSLTTIYSNSSWSCIYSNDMFSGCNSLRSAETNVGKSFDVSMANPERGYFTKKVL